MNHVPQPRSPPGINTAAKEEISPDLIELTDTISQQWSLIQKQSNIINRIVGSQRTAHVELLELRTDVGNIKTQANMWMELYRKESLKNLSLAKELEAAQSLRGDSLVLALIDGDGCIFENDLLKRGRQGGQDAAQMLNERLNDDNSSHQLWVFIFLNFKGLQATLAGSKICTTNEFEEFFVGFNQANSRFSMIDVHSGKEAADAKIKTYLQSWARFPQTTKIYFGGGHDNGYHPTLAELKNAGLLGKLSLLKSYKEIAHEIASLNLQIMDTGNLFRKEKIVTFSRKVSGSSAARPAEVDSSPPPTSSEHSASAPPSPAVRNQAPSAPARSGSTGRRINPNIELSKHNPPPCNMFYLSKCNKGADCNYAHDYILEAEHYDILKVNAKKSPCPAVNSDFTCTYDDQCLFGHKCPQGPKCFYRKQDKCKFKGETMHS